MSRATKLPRISETEFLGQVLKLAKLCGWRRAHFRPARLADGSWRTAVQGDGKGFPDLVLIKPPRLIFAELKKDKEYPTDDQAAWLADLERVPGIMACIWRPKDFDKIVLILQE